MKHRFPNKVITSTHEVTKGKTFTWSPSRKYFADENGISDYNYDAMIWLKENGWLVQLPWNSVSAVHKFLMKV